MGRTLTLLVTTVLCIGTLPTRCVQAVPRENSNACDIRAEPAQGPRGSRVQVSGQCSGIRYHRTVDVHLGPMRVVSFDGVGANYDTSFTVPPDTYPGTYELTLTAPFGTASTAFEVFGEAPGCPGDCNGDERVSINELMTGIRIALRRDLLDVCDAFDTDASDSVSITELIKASNAALVGCERVRRCRSSRECSAPLFCKPPIESSRNQSACTFDSQCADNQECGPSGYCIDEECGSRDDCPPQHICRQNRRNHRMECVRPTCASDCPDGFCVNGQCWGSLGTCGE